VRAHLEKLLVADDVEMEDTELAVLDVEGPRAAAILAKAGASEAESLVPWHFADRDGMIVANVPRLGPSAFSIIAERRELEALAMRLEPEGAFSIGGSAPAVLRVENGIAKVGLDTNDKTLALEARLERAISFNKGCYLGQETVERATARGGLKKRMYGLRFSRAIASGAAVLLDGKEVGRVGSSVVSPRLGPIGLAILHHSAWQPGTSLVVRDTEGDASAQVAEIPFG